MNTWEFYEKNPLLRSKDATIQQICEALRKLSSLNLFDLMIDTEPLIQDMIVQGVAEFLMDEKTLEIATLHGSSL
jgi:hypothetical protein